MVSTIFEYQYHPTVRCHSKIWQSERLGSFEYWTSLLFGSQLYRPSNITIYKSANFVESVPVGGGIILGDIEGPVKCAFRETLPNAKGTISGTGNVPGPPEITMESDVI